MNLSKFLYTKGIQCQKALWLKKYKKEVLTPPDATALARFESGNIVDNLACKLFPNGREVVYNASNFNTRVLCDFIPVFIFLRKKKYNQAVFNCASTEL